MAKNLVQRVGDVIDFTATATLASGAGVLVGSVFGIVQIDVVSGDVMPVSTKGVWNINKLSTDVFAEGALVYWDNTNKRVTSTSAGNTLIGTCATRGGVANPSATVDVKLAETT